MHARIESSHTYNAELIDHKTSYHNRKHSQECNANFIIKMPIVSIVASIASVVRLTIYGLNDNIHYYSCMRVVMSAQ